MLKVFRGNPLKPALIFPAPQYFAVSSLLFSTSIAIIGVDTILDKPEITSKPIKPHPITATLSPNSGLAASPFLKPFTLLPVSTIIPDYLLY